MSSELSQKEIDELLTAVDLDEEGEEQYLSDIGREWSNFERLLFEGDPKASHRLTEAEVNAFIDNPHTLFESTDGIEDTIGNCINRLTEAGF